jgi:plasmid replication initiation protein
MNKSMTVTQGYELVNSKFKLNTSEIKFILIALTQIDSKSDNDFQEYTIKLSELEKKLQAEQHETRLKQFAKKLMSKPLEIPIEGGFEIYNWFSKIRYKNGIFTVRIDPDLKPYLLQLKKRFVAYNLKYILPLTSAYSIRIYQLLKEHQKLTKRYFDVEELMDLLQVPKSLKRYSQFKQKVLQVTEKELLEHCDICFAFDEEKTGKKVTRLVFRIYPNQKVVDKKEAVTIVDYSSYYGINCKIKGNICEHLLQVNQLEDGSVNCSFRSGENYHFNTFEDLLSTKI